ncbi:hybrid sensor histidine kinase/response regulator [Rhodothermus profundi]|uniref:histidine kinase n=1 Tax=Rhodothermus profundi TaxID=633813 RepID=A0A1M6VA48_9BACT|nr:ATP-binding protein [Rhodothermus profundi]SHK78329.1 Response regulator receiver domain-containing protein [Rhodothermus profundi]
MSSRAPEFTSEPTLFIATLSPQGTCYEANPPWEELFGRLAAPWQRLSSEDQERFRDLLDQAARGRRILHEVLMLQLPGRDEPVPALFNLIPVRLPAHGDAPVALVVTVELLVEPSSLTYSQNQRHRLETLGRMALGIAHDFNNLLMTFLGHLELLRRALASASAREEIKHHLQALERAALDGAALMRKLQEYVRQEKPTPLESIDLPTLLEECLMLTRPYWYNEPRRQGIDIRLETHLEPVPPIRGIASELRQVFTNLILNAVQAMPQGGTLRVETDFGEQQGVMVRVSDTGIGMPESVRRRIFEPLFTTKPEGSGMGLAIVAGIVREHEGRIEVKSAPGEGTTFTLYFPPAETTQRTPAAAQEEAAVRPVRVLLVDDEAGVRNVLSRLLALHGHTVVQAASATEALRQLQHTSFDIVFTDQGMPEISGLELARRIREQHPELPIVLITGDTEVQAERGLVNAILQKPFRLETLAQLIRQLCAQRTS